MLKEVGIETDLEVMEYGSYRKKLMIEGAYDIGMTTGGTVGPDPVIVERFFTTWGIHHPPLTYTNFARYSNSRVDELFKKGAEIPDIEKRKEYYYEVQDIIMEESWVEDVPKA